jgi:hypothetical protein
VQKKGQEKQAGFAIETSTIDADEMDLGDAAEYAKHVEEMQA